MTTSPSAAPLRPPPPAPGSRAPSAAPPTHRPPFGRHLRRALPFVLPFCALFVCVYLIPIGYSIYESLFRVKRSGLGLGEPETVFAGLDNYVKVLTDTAFLASIGRVLMIGVVQVPVMLGLALLFALLIDARTTIGRKFFRIAYFLPYGLPGVIAGIMWSFLYAPSLSPIVQFFARLGIDISFTSDGALPWAIANILTWAWTGYNMIIIYAALQSIPGEIMEAAAIDGCSGWKAAWRIKVPIVRPAILLTLVFSIIGTAQLYNEPVTMKAIAPNLPSDYTPIMSALASVSANNFNYAATQAVVLALFIFVASFFFFRKSNQDGDGS